MRIERKGPVARLTPRLVRFFHEALGGIALDDLQHAQARKADYKCLNGLLAIELKSLEDDASERMNNLTDELRERPDWPIFLGSAPMQSFLQHIEEPDEVRRQIVDRIGRAIKSHLRKANKQLAAHALDFPRKNLVKVIVIANEDHEIYDPEMVAYIIKHLLRRHDNGVPLYAHVDAVVFFSERHATTKPGQIAFPILYVEGPSIEHALWKREVMELFLLRWSLWNGVPLYKADPTKEKFSTIEHVPDQMRRYEKWELDYRRNPYMNDFTDEQVRERFDELICVSSLAFIKDSPFKPDESAINWSMSSMSHMMIEMGRRAIPMTKFQSEPERLAEAARRLGFSSEVISWFRANMGRAS